MIVLYREDAPPQRHLDFKDSVYSQHVLLLYPYEDGI